MIADPPTLKKTTIVLAPSVFLLRNYHLVTQKEKGAGLQLLQRIFLGTMPKIVALLLKVLGHKLFFSCRINVML